MTPHCLRLSERFLPVRVAAVAALLVAGLGVGAWSPARAAAPVGEPRLLSQAPAQAAVPPAQPGPAAAVLATPAGDEAQRALDARVADAQDAWRKKDRARLAEHRDALAAARHPLAMWADYWELNARLGEAQQAELTAFWARWPGTYVEDRLRNDWLLELGKRRDWANFALEFPRFRLNDDREVGCYQLLLRHQAGDDVRAAARSAWLAQREVDDGCALLAQTLVEAGRFTPADVWLKVRQSAEAGRLRASRVAVALLADAPADKLYTEAWEQPARFLARKALPRGRTGQELVIVALVRLATTDPAAAAAQLDERWQAALGVDAPWTWAAVAKQAAWKLQPEADGWFERAVALQPQAPGGMDWADDTQAWRARAALRAVQDPARWSHVLAAIAAMTPTQQADPAWQYWKARALTESAGSGPAGDAQRMAALLVYERIASQYHFYGQLAAEALGRAQALPGRPAPPTPAERERAERDPGLGRALALLALGLRSEGVREWNFGVREMGDRELLAAAQRACDRQAWDRCIQASERTRVEVDFAQRFPQPWRDDVTAAAREAGLDPALVYGLIRQESRFVVDIRSSAGAAGLMQVMPSTARWVARRIGLPYTPDMITDRATNLRLGATYLKQVLDDLGGSQALATAGYNAGPSRPRRWRDGPTLETAIWAENVPINETRDYVKKVLSNAAYYAALMGGQGYAQLRPRLQPPVGPRDAAAPVENRELP